MTFHYNYQAVPLYVATHGTIGDLMPSTVILHKFTKSNQSTTQSPEMELTVSVKFIIKTRISFTSAPDIRHLPEDEGIEIAFAGRSMLVNLAH